MHRPRVAMAGGFLRDDLIHKAGMRLRITTVIRSTSG